MGEIVNDLLQGLKLHLQAKMIDSVPAEYAALLAYTDMNGEARVLKPSLVQIGRLQDDPTALSENLAEPSIHVAIHENDPDDLSDGWKHTVASSVDSSATNLSLHLGYPYEIGGAEHWWRRFRVSFEAYFIDSDQTKEEATRLANLIRGLLEKYCGSYRPWNLHGWQCGGIEDTFHETAMEAHVAKSHCWAGGGPDDDYIWRGAVWVQVLTARE